MAKSVQGGFLVKYSIWPGMYRVFHTLVNTGVKDHV